MNEVDLPIKPAKPLQGRGYGSIPHLIGSRRGPGDRGVNEGQQRIATLKARDRFDEVLVQEKLDGSNVSAALLDGQLLALTRTGQLAKGSNFPQHTLWADWVRRHEDRFRAVLHEGERLVGEWLALAHGTLYKLPHEPFVAFDLMNGATRLPFDQFAARLNGAFVTPRLIHRGGPMSVEAMLQVLEPSGHGALEPVEGAVWRVERDDPHRKVRVVDFLAKYVRGEKEDGKYLPMAAHPDREPVWLWRPKDEENQR